MVDDVWTGTQCTSNFPREGTEAQDAIQLQRGWRPGGHLLMSRRVLPGRTGAPEARALRTAVRLDST